MSPRAAAFSIYSGWGYGEFHPQGTVGAWVARTSNGTTAHSISSYYNIEVDSSDNVYGLSYLLSTGQWVTKYNSSGVLQWIISFNPTGIDAQYTNSSGTTIAAIGSRILSIDSSGALSWAKNYPGLSSAGGVRRITTDSSGNIYISALYNILALDSSGTVLWWKTLSGTLSNFEYIACYGSNLYLTAVRVSNGHQAFVKINTSGTMIWSYDVPFNIFSIKIDNAGKILLNGNATVSGWLSLYVAKITDAGSSISVDWQNTYNSTAFLTLGSGYIACDSTNNYYASAGSAYICKLDTSGNVIWTRHFTPLRSPINMGMTSTNKLYVSNVQLWQLPINGLGVGAHSFASPTAIAQYAGDSFAINTFVKTTASYSYTSFTNGTLTNTTGTVTNVTQTVSYVTGYSNQRIDF